MAVFGGPNWREEFKIQQHFGPVILFDELEALVDALKYLRERSYVAHEIDCGKLQTPEAIMNDVLRRMGIINPASTYENIRDIQFWDLLRDAEVPHESGLVLAFKYFGGFHRAFPEAAQAMLNSIASEHWYQMHRGRRFWACAHCEDRELKLEPVLILRATWNRQRWSAQALAREAKAGPFLQALKEVRAVLTARFPGARRGGLEKALIKVAGVQDLGELIDRELSAEDILLLLRDYKFDE